MKLDALIIAAHPDDAEIALGGTILRMAQTGKAVGVLDLTRGELGSRGDREVRDREAEQAASVLGLAQRINLNLPDGRVVAGLEQREALAAEIRTYQPDTVFAHHIEDLHPDHVAAGELSGQAWYLAGLRRLAEQAGGPPAWRPRHLLRFMGHRAFEPTFVVDISGVFEQKVEVIRTYTSQLRPEGPGDDGSHFLFGADILQRMESKAR